VSDGSSISTRRALGTICKAQGVAKLGLAPLVMAHTRAATHGDVTVANAHPFEAGPFVLAHNGVIFNHEEVNAKRQRKCAVDSEHLVLNLAEGVPFTELEGYGAVEYFDRTQPDAVKLCRMRNGSLAVYGVESARNRPAGVVWSSDAAHLESALGAARLDYFRYREPEEGVVYTVRGGGLYRSKEILKLREPTTVSNLGWYYDRTNGVRPWRDAGQSDVGRYYRCTQIAERLGLTYLGDSHWADEAGEVYDEADLMLLAWTEKQDGESIVSESVDVTKLGTEV
jgi:hypothetical protein